MMRGISRPHRVEYTWLLSHGLLRGRIIFGRVCVPRRRMLLSLRL